MALQHIKKNPLLIEDYLQYKAQVCRQEYADVARAEERLPMREAAWPEYRDADILTHVPAYLTATVTPTGDAPSQDGGPQPTDATFPRVTDHLGWERAGGSNPPGASINVPVSTWTVSDVTSWAAAAVDASFAEALAANDINGKDLLELTDAELETELEYSCPEKRDTIMELIRQLHEQTEQQGSDHIIEEARAWRNTYLRDHTQIIQEHRQHHIHIPNEKGERVPLTHCRRKDNPQECKADFPRTKWLIDKPVVLCKCLLDNMGMPSSGRRNKIGSLHGPMNHEWLNGTHPAMLAAHRFNSDVQVPYRLPICEATISCEGKCLASVDEEEMILASQLAQDAQAGYACDYCNKRQPMAFSECKECLKGIRRMGEGMEKKSLRYKIKRYALRICSDAYGKGIVRGHTENTNLCAYTKDNILTSAETVRTAGTESFYGGEYLNVVERLNDQKDKATRKDFPIIDKRNPRKRKVTLKDTCILYGQRPSDPHVWFLSPYEFTMHWEVCMLSYPLCIEDIYSTNHHVDLTDSGYEKLQAYKSDLLPEEDYVVGKGAIDGQGREWLPYPETASTQSFRHIWIMRRRKRPSVPSFAGSPVPKHASGEHERSAAIVLAYFHPWTLRQQDADEHVPWAGSLRRRDESWQEALKGWLEGNVLCLEAQQLVGNFMCVHRVRPQDDRDSSGGNSDDVVSDEDLTVSHDSLANALKTRVGGREDGEKTADNSTHRENSTSAMQLGEDVWGAQDDATAHAEPAPHVSAPDNLQEIFKAARTSQSRERSFKRTLDEDPHSGSVTERRAESVADVDTWLAALPHRKDDKGRPRVNAEQLQAVHVVATRVKEQIPNPCSGEPLRWLLHGGPGTGKSHVIKLVQELFHEVLEWKPGVQYQAAALQAVTADLINGDTLHHACGIPVFSKKKEKTEAAQSHIDTAKRALQWRWLIIDEISMVSAKLLATIDMKLRATIRELGTTKLAGDKTSRPFGGLNVLIVGDFWQLEPPDGGFLGSIPVDYILQGRKFQPAPTISHGQALLWSGPKTGVQGVTELHQCERQDDEWLEDMQEEIRSGALSEDNYNFMHGLPTSVPGSWHRGDVLCGRAACKKLAKVQPSQQSSNKAKAKAAPTKGHTRNATTYKRPRHSTPEDRAQAMGRDAIHMQECKVCKEERASKALVASGPHDPRWSQERFSSAPAIFPNNDTKYHVNKLRARLFAAQHQRVITYAVAQDKPSSETLKKRPSSAGEKLEWLQRHDRACGDLYGMLPLIHGAPYALTDHLDRNPEKQLLRGKLAIFTAGSWTHERPATWKMEPACWSACRW